MYLNKTTIGSHVIACQIMVLLTTAAGSTGEQPAPKPDTAPSGPSFVSGIRLPEGEDSATVRLLPGAGSYYAHVQINGRDAGVFQVDSGATVTVIDRQFAEQRRLPVMGRRQMNVTGFQDVIGYEARILTFPPIVYQFLC